MVLRLTHTYLRERLPTLDRFEDVFAETNEAVSMVSFDNRISRHVYIELRSDIFQCFAYNTDTQRCTNGLEP